MNNFFRKFSQKTSEAVGSPGAFIIALLLLVLWGVSGPFFHFSDTWQLVINTATTIITFLMVFLIQNMQNRDAKAIHLKLDELIRSVEGARNTLVNLEELSDEELEKLQLQFRRLSKQNPTASGNLAAGVAAVNIVEASVDKKRKSKNGKTRLGHRYR